MSTDEIDVYAATKQRAVVAKALRDLHPGGELRGYLADAAAVLLALDEFYNDRQHDGQAADELHEMPAAALTAEQEMRARALDSAAHLLGPAVSALAEQTSPRERGEMFAAVSGIWVHMAEICAAFINTGEVPEDEDVFEDFCAGCGGPCRCESDDEDDDEDDDPAEPLPSSVATEVAEKLWALHIEGPDDIIAMPDRATAEIKAAEVNAVAKTLRERPDASPNDPTLLAHVVEWLDGEEEHAEALAAVIAEGEYLP